MTCNEFAEALRVGPYSSVGSYPIFFATGHDVICHGCAGRERHHIRASIRRHMARMPCDRDWLVQTVQVNWESPDMYCSVCSAPIEAAYV